MSTFESYRLDVVGHKLGFMETYYGFVCCVKFIVASLFVLMIY